MPTDEDQDLRLDGGLCPSCGGQCWTDGTETACVDCGDGDRASVGLDGVAALRAWYTVLCPRCGADRAVSFGAQYSCGRCGAVWQV